MSHIGRCLMLGYLSPKDVARICEVSLPTCYRWIRTGKLAAVRLAGHQLGITRAAVDALIAPVEAAGSARAAQKRRLERAVQELREAGFSVA